MHPDYTHIRITCTLLYLAWNTFVFTNFLCLLGNLITVDDYLKNEGWVKCIEGAFSRFDTNKDGLVGFDDWEKMG